MNFKLIPVAVLAVLTVGFGMPTEAFAANIDHWNPGAISLIGCDPSCPTSWILVTNNNPYVNSGREYMDYSVSWLEGYDDIDRKVREPNNITNHYSTAGGAHTSETGHFSNPAAGYWDEHYKVWSIGASDTSGATQGTFYTVAYEYP